MTSKEKLKKINKLSAFIMVTSNESKTKSILEVIMALCLCNKKELEEKKELIKEVLNDVGFPQDFYLKD